MSIGSRLKLRREELGLTQTELAKLVGVSKGSIGNYESEISSPNENILIKLFSALDCDANYLYHDDINKSNDSISNTELQHIKKYRALDEHGKKIVDFVLNEEYDRSTEQDEGELIQTNCIVLTMYEDAVSAGTGEYLNDGRCVEVTVDETPLTERADFILRVSGDSMEPTYYDGDKVLVQNAVELNVGEIGIFVLNGQGYIKEYRPEGLFSHNKKYGIIKVGENDRCDVVGRVIGKV